MDDGNRIGRQEPVVSGCWKKNGSGSGEPGANEPDILHITNQIGFAQAFIEIARQEYGAGNIPAGDNARRAAREAFWESKRSLNELAEEHKTSVSRELEAIEHALAKLALPP